MHPASLPTAINTNFTYTDDAQSSSAAATPTSASPVDAPNRERAKESGSMRRRISSAMKNPLSPTFNKLFKSGQSSAPSVPLRNTEERKQQIRTERTEREASLQPTETSAQIRKALANVKNDPNAKVLMFGYSPTGGGHTGRMLNILEESLKDGEFKQGDVVIAHVPSTWNGKPRAPQLTSLSQKFTQAGIPVLLLEAEKSVQGYLREDGASDDPKILDRIAKMPKRDDADITTITQAKVFAGDGDFTSLQSIDANHLLDSVSEELGAENMNKVYVLTDMDPALQKAAQRFGVPNEHRVDQQNHPILLELDGNNLEKNLQSHMGVLAKVLGGHGEYIAYIGLGEKNTLQKVADTAAKLKLTPETSKQEALHTVSDFFIKNANPVNVSALTTGPDAYGILHHPSITDASQVKNMVYVYANDNQAEVAKYIGGKIDEGDPKCKDTLYVFCGKDTFKPGVSGNALHMAYLADADGITTAGAGTVGEFCYLHKSGEAQSKFMAIPIAGHNEQEANAQFLLGDPSVNQYVTVAKVPLGDDLELFIAEGHENVANKYEEQTLSGVLTAVGNKDTYPSHGSKLLAGTEKMTDDEQKISYIEGKMNKNAVLSANRHFQKLVFQAITDLTPSILAAPTTASGILGSKIGRRLSTGPAAKAVEIKLRKADEPKTFKDAKELKNFLVDLKELTRYLGDGEELSPNNILLLKETQTLFRNIAAKVYTGDRAIAEMEKLKTEFGHHTTTGF
jgi:hypothetical protein